MAETKPNAALRPRQGVPHSATHSGVTHVRAYQPNRYTIIGNHLAQHRGLSLTAIGLAVHILSLPEGASADIRTLAAHFPEGRDRIAFALRELEATGYIDRVRERVGGGRVVTRTYAHHAPALSRAAAERQMPREACEAGGSEAAVAVRDEPPARECVPPPPADRVEPAEPPRSEHHDQAFALLAGLRRTDSRLTLSARDVHRLTPAVTAWFDNGIGRAAVHHALTADLPALVKCPASLLAHRLRELLPPPLPPQPEAPATGTGTGRHRPHPFQDCDGCHRVFRAPEPGRCRDCRSVSPARTATVDAVRAA
ncbi:helix-turn-helix domain-containing protein [Streptomyces sp. HMX87]|uniref:helix-turn-helix domain-containing protein n=1 Tax=Streptomyces sp. HMX87 TaxID=3390849 RepID=UPI003A848DD7